ncbi:MAG: RDD family protein [Microthrixaceae bacterium]|nr:RDD family protein [Microthrixaceae bacterium]
MTDSNGEPPTAPARSAGSGPGSIPPIWIRLVARLLDALVIEAPFLAWAFAAGIVRSVGGEVRLEAPGWFLVLSTLVPVVYEWAAISIFGRTIGKAVMGLRVARVSDDGKPNAQQAAFRILVPAVPEFVLLAIPDSDSMIAFILSVAGQYVYLTSLFHPQGRGLHDRAAGTIVLRAR